VSVMGLTLCYKTTVFLHLYIIWAQNLSMGHSHDSASFSGGSSSLG